MTPLDIIKFSRGIQANLITELDNASNIRHPTAQGDEGERAWTDFLNKSLPRRYAVRSGQILDSHGNTSDQIDVILYDPQYTPVWFPLREHAYVLAEAVYAVFEVKTEARGQHRVRRRQGRLRPPPPPHLRPRTPLRRPQAAEGPPSRSSPASSPGRAAGRPTPSPSSPITSPSTSATAASILGIALDTGAFEFAPTAATPLAYLPGDTALVHFLYRLLARLQALGTVPAIDWSAYANRFGAAAPLA
jgi:hypothetical protein